ncbi:MAG: PEP-CTERM sorting domain-containing protein [Tepidisphaerales bacterium]
MRYNYAHRAGAQVPADPASACRGRGWGTLARKGVGLICVLGPAGAAAAGDSTNTAGMPTSGSTAQNPYIVNVYTGKPPKATPVKVPNIVATAGLMPNPPGPTAAQVAAASAAKAKAIVDAVTAAAAADAAKVPAGPLANVTASVGNTVAWPTYFPTGTDATVRLPNGQVVKLPQVAKPDMTQFTISGVTAGATQAGNTTGEIGNGRNFNQNGGGGGGGSMNRGSMSGTGSSSGMSMGSDASGNPSVVGFGFIDMTTTTPTDYIVAFEPPSGLTDSVVLGGLAGFFNATFASSGYSATYDPGSDTLSLDQPMPEADFFWDANSDPGLNFSDSVVAVPEPSTLALFAAAVACLLPRRRCRGRRVESPG